LPWEIAKAFDQSAPISTFIPLNDLGDAENIKFHMELNGNVVQKGESNDMIFPIDKVIAYVSKFITLKMGDLIYTGTPEGVGPVKVGDHMVGWIEDKKMFDFRVK